MDKDSLTDVLAAAKRSKTLTAAMWALVGWAAKILGVAGWALVLKVLSAPTLNDIAVRVTPAVAAAKEAQSNVLHVDDREKQEVRSLWRMVITLEMTRRGVPDTLRENAELRYDACTDTPERCARAELGLKYRGTP